MKFKWRIFFGLIILALLVYLLIRINFVEVWTLVVKANNWYFFLTFLCYLASFFIFDFKSAYFIKEIAPVSYFFNLKTTFAGFFVNMITPGSQLGGDPVRAYFIGKKYGKPKAKLLGIILADKTIHVVVSIFFIMASILFILAYIPVSFELKVIFETLFFSILLFLLFFGYVSFGKTGFNIEVFLKRFRWVFPKANSMRGRKTKLEKILIKHFGHFSKIFKTTLKDKELLIIGASWSTVYWLLHFLASYFLFLSFGQDVNFLLVIVVISMSNFLGTFSPIPGGIGLIEGAMILFYSLLGVNLSIAVAVSLLSRIVFYFFSLVIGSISLVHLEHSVK